MTRAARALALALAALSSACHGKSEPTEGATPAVDVSPVPAPADLLATVAMATPDATWQHLQRGMGGGAGILPSTLGGILCAMTGLDPTLALAIDGASPAYVVVAGPIDAPAWVLAARLVDARRVRASIEGETSHFDVHVADGFEVAVPKTHGGPATRQPGIAITPDGWLAIATSEDSLTKLAPYATRTMPTLAKPAAADGASPEAIAIDVPQSALASSLGDRVAEQWAVTRGQMLESDRAQRAAHGGRAPDFGDPSAIVALMDGAMHARLAVLSDLAGAHVGVTVGDGDLRVVATAKVASPAGAASKAIAGIASGDVTPLFAVTGDAVAALLVRSTDDAQSQGSGDFESAFTSALGPRLTPDGAKRIHAALGDWAQAKGDAWTAAVVSSGAALGKNSGVVADAMAKDPKVAARAIGEALESATKIPALREPLATWLGIRDVKLGAVDVPGGGRATLASLVRDAPPPVAIAWIAGANDVKIALGETPAPLLAPPPPGHTLGDDPAIRAALAAIGPAAGAVLVQPSLVGRAGCEGAQGAVVLAWGRRDQGGAPSLWASVVSTDAAVRCIAKAAF